MKNKYAASIDYLDEVRVMVSSGKSEEHWLPLLDKHELRFATEDEARFWLNTYSITIEDMEFTGKNKCSFFLTVSEIFENDFSSPNPESFEPIAGRKIYAALKVEHLEDIRNI